MDHIINNLWVGSQRDADELVHNNPEKITAILNVRGPDAYDPPGRNQAAEHPGKAYKWIPAPDIATVSRNHVKEALLWLREQTEKNERILIHCKHGISRSPAILAAFMVESGMSANMEEAKATISNYRHVKPAAQTVEWITPVLLVSAVTGLPNRHAFDQGEVSPIVGIADIDFMKAFVDFYGPIAGDALLRRLANILLSVQLDVFHYQRDEFLCKGASRQEVETKLSQARQLFSEPFEIYAQGRIRTIEGMDFSFRIATGLEEAEGALNTAKVIAGNEPPEWLRRIIGEGGDLGVW